MIIAKCDSCHHEIQTQEEGEICGWCRQGTLRKLSDCPDFDPYAVLGKLRKFGRAKP